MSNVKEVIQQQFVEQTQQLVARGGPVALRSAGRLLLQASITASAIRNRSE